MRGEMREIEMSLCQNVFTTKLHFKGNMEILTLVQKPGGEKPADCRKLESDAGFGDRKT